MRARLRTLGVLLGALALAALVGAPSAVGTDLISPGTGITLGFYSVPYGPMLLWVRPTGGAVEIRGSTFAEWQEQGFPAPMAAGVRYVRVAGFDTILAQHEIPGAWPPRRVFTQALGYEQWALAGFPAPVEVPRSELPGLVGYDTYLSSPAVYARVSFETRELTYAQWAALGFPQPQLRGWAPGESIVRFASSPEVFSSGMSGFHKLTFAEWTSIGRPSPLLFTAEFFKLAWDDGVARVFEGHGERLGYDEWARFAFPTPVVVSTIPGDSYCFDSASDGLRYDGATVARTLSAAEAQAYLGIDIHATAACGT